MNYDHNYQSINRPSRLRRYLLYLKKALKQKRKPLSRKQRIRIRRLQRRKEPRKVWRTVYLSIPYHEQFARVARRVLNPPPAPKPFTAEW